MIETVRDLVGHPGRYEGLSAFEIWLCESLDGIQEEECGDVEAPNMWNARAGRFIITVDNLGFHYVCRFGSRDSATEHFRTIARQYNRWAEHNNE